MVSVEVPIVIGEEFVEAAKQAVEKATAPFRNVAEYRIDAEHAEDHWVTVTHIPCDRFVFGNPGDPDGLDAATLLALIAAHQCPTGKHAVPDLGGHAAPITFITGENGNPQPQWPTHPSSAPGD